MEKAYRTRNWKLVILIAKLALVFSVIGLWSFLFINFEVLQNNTRVTLWAHTPSTVEAGEAFNIDIQAWDKYERIAGAFKGEIAFSLESYSFGSPDITAIPNPVWNLESAEARFTSNFIWRGWTPAYKVAGADNGRKSFTATINTPGLHYLIVKEEVTRFTYRSNPIVVYPSGASFNHLYWGDIHGHSIFSDGSGWPTEVYKFGRDVALLDFQAITDHAEVFPRLGDLDLFNRFRDYIQITNDFNDPGNFATLVALEWTPLLSSARKYLAPGHINFYFRGDTMPFFSTFTDPNPGELYKYVRENSDGEFLAWTHHTIRDQYWSDFAFYEPEINTMIEVYSCHGSCEMVGDLNLYPQVHEVPEGSYGYSVGDLLRMGRKCGLMASSDGHDGRMGHFIGHTEARALSQQPFTLSAYQYGVPYPGGLIGIYTAQLERTHLYDALANRSAFGATWMNRPFMEFSVNGVSVGQHNSTVTVDSSTATRTIDIRVAVDGVAMRPDSGKKIKQIQVFKNSELAWERDVNELAVKWSFTDSHEITGTSYEHCIQKEDGNWYIHENSIQPVDPTTLNTNGADFYYARMTDTEGGAAWIGPIWVEVA